MAIGFASSAVLILSRGALSGTLSPWVVLSFSVPIVYCSYNWFAARYWPKNADIMVVGASEAFFSGLLGIPFMLLFAPPWSPGSPALGAYLPALLATLMWIIRLMPGRSSRAFPSPLRQPSQRGDRPLASPSIGRRQC